MIVGQHDPSEEYDYSPISRDKHDFVIMEIFDQGVSQYTFKGKRKKTHKGTAILRGLEVKTSGPTEGEPKDLSVYVYLGKNSLGSPDRKSVLWELYEAARNTAIQDGDKVDTNDLVGETVSVLVGHKASKKEGSDRVYAEAKEFIHCPLTIDDFPDIDLDSYESIGTRWGLSDSSDDKRERESFDYGANKKESDDDDDRMP